MELKLLSLKATSVAEVGICLNRDTVLDVSYHIPGLNEIKTNFPDINFDGDLFSQIAKSRFFAWIYLLAIVFKNFGFLEKKKKR